jgi:hypothetical protein
MEESERGHGACISHRPSHRHASPIDDLIDVPLTGVHLSYTCLSHRPSHRLVSHRRAPPIGHPIGVSLIGVHPSQAVSYACLSYVCLSHRQSHRRTSHRRATLIGRISHRCISLDRRAAPICIRLIAVRLGQACSPHRTYISQTRVLDRHATRRGHTLTGHVSHGRSDLALTANLTQTVPRHGGVE